ncbi:Lrp/AsnC family transcriptional regulator [Hoeflea sp. WL0058]|uniref:Lrp/AsnC family transcriptional regulator n=1 Tax=Flavimaribacter sediminis TaxID=2865987 RepID=A0AAE2ZLD9_9HYPH|nr:Lrp/AsnC family transcriptional regulator [Flavimaribacter sediminis]
MDDIDKKILALLQKDCTLPATEIASRVGLSATPCWRRIQKLEEEKFIRSRVALLDSVKLNVDVTAFIAVRTNQHNRAWLDKFEKAVSDMDEVVDFFRLSGDIDYLIRVALPNIKAYDAFYKRLIEKVDMSDVNCMFAMETIKSTTELPLHYAETKLR